LSLTTQSGLSYFEPPAPSADRRFLAQALSWHWIFLVSPPVGVVGFLLTLRYMPEDGDSAAVLEVDFPGAELLVASLMIAVFAIVQTGQYGGSGTRSALALWPSR
jgi:hypothetical protein